MKFIGLTPSLLNFFNCSKAAVTNRLNTAFRVYLETSTSYNSHEKTNFKKIPLLFVITTYIKSSYSTNNSGLYDKRALVLYNSKINNKCILFKYSPCSLWVGLFEPDNYFKSDIDKKSVEVEKFFTNTDKSRFLELSVMYDHESNHLLRSLAIIYPQISYISWKR